VLNGLRPWIMVCALGGSAALAAWAHAVPPPLHVEQILVDSAEDSRDHALLAWYFTQKAAQMREAAEQHRRMGRSYGRRDTIVQRFELKSHCDDLARLDEQIAAEYEALAKRHEAESMR